MDVRHYNRGAWDSAVDKKNRWTVPVTREQVALAREGDLRFVLTPNKPVPKAWLGDVKGLDVLCLASGGGQQAPLLAAAGANVTLVDNSPRQLEQDRLVAEREGLTIELALGDMRDLSQFVPESFDLIVNPCSVSFVPDVREVWRAAARVARRGAVLLTGVCNPLVFALDPELEKKGVAQLRFAAPYSDLTSLTDAERAVYTDANEPLCFGHSLEDLLGGQLDAGFVITAMYEDKSGDADNALDKYLPGYLATRAVRR